LAAYEALLAPLLPPALQERVAADIFELQLVALAIVPQLDFFAVALFTLHPEPLALIWPGHPTAAVDVAEVAPLCAEHEPDSGVRADLMPLQ